MKDLSDLRLYLSKKTKLTEQVTTHYTNPPKGTFYVNINNKTYSVNKQYLKGGIEVYKNTDPFNIIEFPVNTKFDDIFTLSPRNIFEFGVKINIKPKAYKYCEGGGWYSMRDIYEIDGEEYCDLSP